MIVINIEKENQKNGNFERLSNKIWSQSRFEIIFFQLLISQTSPFKSRLDFILTFIEFPMEMNGSWKQTKNSINSSAQYKFHKL